MLSLARQALERQRQVVYLHAALDAEHHAFRDEITLLQTEHTGRLKTVTVHEQGEDGHHLAVAAPVEARFLAEGNDDGASQVDRADKAPDVAFIFNATSCITLTI